MPDLYLPLKREYFQQIKSGEKTEEFRLANDYWANRIVGRQYETIILTDGYPPKSDETRRITRMWRGYRKTVITHPHFGPDPVEVYAIRVN
ncbi:RNA-binding protein [Leisingera sp. ANG-M7]|uniref:RNA-binding protein n=1 Tax=Leisingera sp. ANG-M7 TaxID=1577902 RepID=UPI00057CFD3C|nr:RNA-binding protein [Leisingera sp. ANG-M7]KIC36539.1 RNA-binding protein [Leisingera sp. ANG-M7]